MKSTWKSLLFVIVQFITLGLIGLTGPIFPDGTLLFALEMIGIGLGIWAVIVMRPGYFNITPDPISGSLLVSRGPYRLIRHPMYLALLLTTLPLIINHFNGLRFLYWVILFVDLILKIKYEERLLLSDIDGYDTYQNESYRLLPYFY